uniref:Uncharacterized protein n=1 Tax=Chelonoidis abingdonii TaxID=106734 RepID=A0A8C0IM31_CHEAB
MRRGQRLIPAPRTVSSARTTAASPTAGSVTATTTAVTMRMNPTPPALVRSPFVSPAQIQPQGGGAGWRGGQEGRTGHWSLSSSSSRLSVARSSVSAGVPGSPAGQGGTQPF